MARDDGSKRPVAPPDEGATDPDRAAILARRNLFIALAMSSVAATSAVSACGGEMTGEGSGSAGATTGGFLPCLSIVGDSGVGGALVCLNPASGGALPCVEVAMGGSLPCLAAVGGAVTCLGPVATGGLPNVGGAVPCIDPPYGGALICLGVALSGGTAPGAGGAPDVGGALPCLSAGTTAGGQTSGGATPCLRIAAGDGGEAGASGAGQAGSRS